MKRIYVPTESPSGWKRLLASDHHWKPGFSAMSVAQSWEAADGALPPEIAELFRQSPDDRLHGAELVLAIPEYQIELPGGSRPTQTDVFALVRTSSGLATVAVEGKVDETFGPTIEDKRKEGAEARLEYLHSLLELKAADSGQLRYQLLHRTAAAILLAQRFHARAALLVVQSFSPANRWFDDFEALVSLWVSWPSMVGSQRWGRGAAAYTSTSAGQPAIKDSGRISRLPNPAMEPTADIILRKIQGASAPPAHRAR